MEYFVNVYSSTLMGKERMYDYSTYSGKSVNEIKLALLEYLKDSYQDFSEKIDNLEDSPSLTLKKIQEIFNRELKKELRGYELKISDPYTDLNKFVRFYQGYEWFNPKKNTGWDFVIYGNSEIVRKLRKILSNDFPLIRGIRKSDIMKEMVNFQII